MRRIELIIKKTRHIRHTWLFGGICTMVKKDVAHMAHSAQHQSQVCQIFSQENGNAKCSKPLGTPGTAAKSHESQASQVFYNSRAIIVRACVPPCARTYVCKNTWHIRHTWLLRKKPNVSDAFLCQVFLSGLAHLAFKVRAK